MAGLVSALKRRHDDEQVEARQDRARGAPARPRLHGHVGQCTARPTTRRASRTIQAAIERGVTLIDTGDFYGDGPQRDADRPGARAAGATRRSLSVKFGALRGPDGELGRRRHPSGRRRRTSSPTGSSASASTYIDIYRPGAPRPRRADRGDHRRASPRW